MLYLGKLGMFFLMRPESEGKDTEKLNLFETPCHTSRYQCAFVWYFCVSVSVKHSSITAMKV